MGEQENKFWVETSVFTKNLPLAPPPFSILFIDYAENKKTGVSKRWPVSLLALRASWLRCAAAKQPNWGTRVFAAT